MNEVILLTTGTRGDIQPYIALGLALRAAGIPASLATDPQFHGLVSAYSLPFIAVEGNPSTLMIQSARQALTIEGSLIGSLYASLKYMRDALPIYQRMLENAWQACHDARALVVGLPSLWGAHIAEALSIPCIYGFQQPFTRTRTNPSALFPPGLLPAWAPFNRLSHFLIEQAVWQPWRGLMNSWRRNSLGLKNAPWAGINGRLYEPDTLVLNAISAWVSPRPPESPPNHHHTGFWFLDPPPGWKAPAGLNSFLAAGPAPVYVGFGSPGPQHQRSAAEIILHAAQISGLRAVTTLSQQAFPGGETGPRVFCLDDIPHAWLFPHCSALVHHGGTGTTASGLRAGVPALLIPRGTDQFYWSSRLLALGCSPNPLPQRGLSAEKLAHGMDLAANGAEYKLHSRQIGEKIRFETGLANAVNLIMDRLA